MQNRKRNNEELSYQVIIDQSELVLTNPPPLLFSQPYYKKRRLPKRSPGEYTAAFLLKTIHNYPNQTQTENFLQLTEAQLGIHLGRFLYLGKPLTFKRMKNITEVEAKTNWKGFYDRLMIASSIDIKKDSLAYIHEQIIFSDSCKKAAEQLGVPYNALHKFLSENNLEYETFKLMSQEKAIHQWGVDYYKDSYGNIVYTNQRIELAPDAVAALNNTQGLEEKTSELEEPNNATLLFETHTIPSEFISEFISQIEIDDESRSGVEENVPDHATLETLDYDTFKLMSPDDAVKQWGEDYYKNCYEQTDIHNQIIELASELLATLENQQFQGLQEGLTVSDETEQENETMLAHSVDVSNEVYPIEAEADTNELALSIDSTDHYLSSSLYEDGFTLFESNKAEEGDSMQEHVIPKIR